MDREAVERVETKLDELLERVERLQQSVDALRPRRPRKLPPGRSISRDPELQRRFDERVAHIRASGSLEEWERKVMARREEKGDPDWWLRSALDRMDRSDPIS